MKILNNIPALQGLHSLHSNNGLLNNSIQKLSSGLRINKVADDVSGYAISSKINSQIHGVKQANSNAMDSIAIIQTAEGSLNEVTDMLQRIRELVVQSGNGTYVKKDREQIQQEIDHLIAEIDVTTENTEFNTKQLLVGGKPVEEAPFEIELKRTVDENGKEIADLTGKPRLARLDEYAQYSIRVLDSSTADEGTGFTLDGVVFEYYNSENGPYKGSAQPIDIKKVKPEGSTSAVLHTYNTTVGFENFTFSEEEGEFRLTAKEKGSVGNYMVSHMGGTPENEMKSQIGSSANEILDFKFGAISSAMLGLMAPVGTPGYKEILNMEKDSTRVQRKLVNKNSRSEDEMAEEVTTVRAGISVIEDGDIQYAIGAVDKAIGKVLKSRAAMGAYQNRLEHTIEKLNVTEEVMTESYSKIRDTDMAMEMAEYTRTDVLTQSAMAMLAKTNELPSSVLQLLQS